MLLSSFDPFPSQDDLGQGYFYHPFHAKTRRRDDLGSELGGQGRGYFHLYFDFILYSLDEIYGCQCFSRQTDLYPCSRSFYHALDSREHRPRANDLTIAYLDSNDEDYSGCLYIRYIHIIYVYELNSPPALPTFTSLPQTQDKRDIDFGTQVYRAVTLTFEF